MTKELNARFDNVIVRFAAMQGATIVGVPPLIFPKRTTFVIA